jgi:hypothetical protein
LPIWGKGTSFSVENIQGKNVQNALIESIDSRCQDYKGISLDLWMNFPAHYPDTPVVANTQDAWL